MTRRQHEDLVGVLAMLMTFAIGGAIVAALAGPTIVPIAAVLGIAFAKGRLVVLDFLELRGGHHPMRIALICWLSVILIAALSRSLVVLQLG